MLYFSTSSNITRVFGYLVDRVVPIPFDHLVPPDRLHLIDSLNHISLIHDPFPSGYLTFLFFCDIIVYLVEVCVVVGYLWWFNNRDNVVGGEWPIEAFQRLGSSG